MSTLIQSGNSCLRGLLAGCALFFGLTAPAALAQGDPRIPGYLASVSSANLTSTASYLVSLGPRRNDAYQAYVDAYCTLSSTSFYPVSTIEKSSEYVRNLFLAMGYSSGAITMEEVPGGLGHNVYVTKIGSVFPDTFIEFGGHLDTVRGSPGGSDNAAGAAAVVELARVLKDYPNRHSLRFALWVAEEWEADRGGYVGSAFHVQQALQRGERFKAGLNIDQIGWADPQSPTGYMNEISYNGSESERIADLFARVATDYDLGIGFRKNQAIFTSDQWSFWDQGLVAVASMGGWLTYRPKYHECGDTVANINFQNVYKVTQQNVAVAIVLDMEGQSARSTTTQLVSNPNPSMLGEALALTATVSAVSGTPTGNVTFKDGTSTLGTASLGANGVAVLTTGALAAGSHPITAVYGGDATHDGSTSNAVTQVVLAAAPAPPVATALSPARATAGGEGFMLTVMGANFVQYSVVRWNGNDRPTTFRSATQLEASIPASDLAKAGTALVSVFTPPPGGGVSSSLEFLISDPAPTPPGVLAAAYGMDEGSGTIVWDSSGNLSHGTLVNGVSWGTGKYGTALQFDGANDYVSVPTSSYLELSGTGLTIEFWAYVQSGGATPDYAVINKPWETGKMVDPYYQYGVEFYGSSQEFVFFMTTAAGLREFKVPGAYGSWQHVAFTFDGSTVRGYVNGTQSLSVAENGSMTARWTPLLIGVDGAYGQPYKGRLDDLRIYTRCLTQSEIQADMNSPVGGVTLPVISSFSPASGPVGTVVTISGSGLSGVSAVEFNGVAATTFSASGDTQVTATVPAGAGTGPIRVTTPGGSALSASPFTVLSLPVISSFSPASGPVGTVVTISGSGLSGVSAVEFNGVAATTFSASGDTQVTATVPAGAGTGPIRVTTPGGSALSASPFTVTSDNPVPAIVSVLPASATVGSPEFVLTVNGSGFVVTSVVQWNGSARNTAFVSSSQLTASIPASDVAAAGSAQISVMSPPPGGGVSSQVSFAINNPIPVLGAISPASAVAGGQGFTLTVTGSGFLAGSVVRWNGSGRPTTYHSSTHLSAEISSADIATGTLASVTVFNPAPGGGASAAGTFTVNNPIPSISRVTPNTVTAGSGSFIITVEGAGFVTTSTVLWRGSSRLTTFVSPAQLTAIVNESDIASGGTALVTVLNPTPGGGTSNSQTVTVVNPAPIITSLVPASIRAGSAGFSLAVNGSGLVPTSKVRWNGAERPTTYVSPIEVRAAIRRQDLRKPGTAAITVVNPSPGGGTSNTLYFTITR